MQPYGWNDTAPKCSVVYVLPVVLSMLGDPPGRVLDVGCGNGALTAKIKAAGFDVRGIDADADGIDLARAAWPDISFEVEDVAAMAETGEYDFVVSTEVVEHLYDPVAFAGACFRALKPGGWIVLSTPYHGYLKNLLLAASGGWDRHHEALRVGGHIKMWSRATLRALLREAGFEEVRFQGTGRGRYLWKSDVAAAFKPGH